MEKNIFNLIELLKARFPNIVIPKEFLDYLNKQETMNHRITRNENAAPLYKFFQDQQISKENIDPFLTLDSEILNKLDFSQIMTLPSDDVYSFFLDKFSDLFFLQEIALDSEFHTGFNRHGREHLHKVADTAISLLKESNIIPINNLSMNEVIIGAFLHDVGNIVSRKYHGFFGIFILSELFTNYSDNDKLFDSFLNILEIVLFHEVEYGSSLQTLSLLHPTTLCVIIADKTDVSYKRISSKSNVPDAIKDFHVLINLLVSNSTVERLRGSNSTFRWTIDFTPKFDTNQIDIFSSLLKATGRVKFPKEWQILYEEANIEYLFAFNSTILNVYLSRLYFAMKAVFALFPSVEQFHFVIKDIERGISLDRIFSPEDYEEKILQLGKHFYKQEWTSTYLYQALINRKPETHH